MLGIAGVIGPKLVQKHRSILPTMLGKMDSGVSDLTTKDFVHAGVAVGWVGDSKLLPHRLLSWDRQHKIAVIFDGSNYPTEKSEANRPQDFDLDIFSNLAEEYRTIGISSLLNLNGWFRGLIVDLRKNEVVLFNDRYGLGRMYFYRNKDGIFFSSEAKALLAVLPECRKLDFQGLGEWISCGCVLQNRTLFCGISLLPSGSAWTFSSIGNETLQTYFNSSEWIQKPPLEHSDFQQRLSRLFPKVVQRYFTGQNKIGMSLTGGLDGRLVIAFSEADPGKLPCYTFNGPYRDCADVRIARRVSHICRQEHHTISIGDDFFSKFASLAQSSVYLSDGAMDVTGAAEIYVNQIARGIAPVRMTGNFGSEILRGTVAFRPRNLDRTLFSEIINQTIERGKMTYAAERKGKTLSFIVFKQVPWHHYARLSIEQSQLALRSPFLDNDLVNLIFQAPQEFLSNTLLSFRLIKQANARLAEIPTDRGQNLSGGILNKLRFFYQDFWAKAEYSYDYGMPTRLAKLDFAFSPLRLEKLFLGRQKFCHFRTWYRNQLAPHIRDILLDAPTLSRPYWNRNRLRQIVEEHTHGRANFTVEIHKVLSIELMHRSLLEGFA